MTESPEMKDLFTDVNGLEHRGTVPRNFVRLEAWEKQKAIATSKMSEGLAAIVCKTSMPFLSKCYEVTVPRAQFFGRKVFLVSDAQTTLRANIGMSSGHAAFDCKTLEQVIEGRKTAEDREKAVLRWSAGQGKYSQAIASYEFGSKFQTLWHALGWIFLLLRQKLGLA